MSSGSVIGVTSTVGISTALPIGRTSLASEDDCPPEPYSLVNSIGPCSTDQSPMVSKHKFLHTDIDLYIRHINGYYRVTTMQCFHVCLEIGLFKSCKYS